MATQESEGMSTGAKVAIALVALAIVGGGIATGVMLYRRRAQKDAAADAMAKAKAAQEATAKAAAAKAAAVKAAADADKTKHPVAIADAQKKAADAAQKEKEAQDAQDAATMAAAALIPVIPPAAVLTPPIRVEKPLPPPPTIRPRYMPTIPPTSPIRVELPLPSPPKIVPRIDTPAIPPTPPIRVEKPLPPPPPPTPPPTPPSIPMPPKVTSFQRGVGLPPQVCPPGTEKQGGSCYATCRAGYTGAGSLCARQACPPDREYWGGLCYKKCPAGAKRTSFCTCDFGRYGGVKTNCFSRPTIQKLPLGANCPQYGSTYHKTALCTCQKGGIVTSCSLYGDGQKKGTYARGASSPMQCAPNQDNVAGLCYTKCPFGYKGVGATCKPENSTAQRAPMEAEPVWRYDYLNVNNRWY